MSGRRKLLQKFYYKTRLKATGNNPIITVKAEIKVFLLQTLFHPLMFTIDKDNPSSSSVAFSDFNHRPRE